ncbi:MAG: precorrin-2 C(20)-methyltransferase [Candidatus Nitrosothermus koennekii]|nr:MAG: precorrin-2 C(20)-methyltransferase [Candidatus Nitrosothermus koennekii]
MSKLYCIGVGPGDPELITLKGYKRLKECDTIFCPTARKGKESIALSIARSIIEERSVKPKIIELVFPMVKDKSMLEDAWKNNAKIIAEECTDNSVYLCVGDPSLYSTFSYIYKELKNYDIDVEIIPGIASMLSFAAETKISLAEGDDILTIIPACYDLDRAMKVADASNTLIFLKDGRYFANVMKVLKNSKFKKGRLAIAEDVSSNTSKALITDISSIKDIPVEKYFSIMVVKDE